MRNVTPISKADPKGRLDILILRLGQEVCSRVQAQTGVDAWANGGQSFCEELIGQLGIPRKRIDLGKTLAQNLFPQPRAIRRRA